MKRIDEWVRALIRLRETGGRKMTLLGVCPNSAAVTEGAGGGTRRERPVRERKLGLSPCLQAGYQLLHIDPTVDPELPSGEPLPVELLVERSVDLIAFAEAERGRLGPGPTPYEGRAG